MVNLPHEKTELRRLMRRRRGILSTASGAAELAAKRLPVEHFGVLGVVAGYQPAGAEMDPRPLMRRLGALGATITLPMAVRRNATLVFRHVCDPAHFVADAFGILGPPPGEEYIPMIVIAPVLAFDATGARLGQGAGSYDRTLGALRAVASPLVIGLAYAGQEIDAVPVDEHDQRLDAILTEIGYRVF